MKAVSVIHYFEYFLLRLVRAFLWFFPLRVISATGAFAGLIFYTLGIRKAVARDNIILAGICKDSRHLKQLLKSNYKNLGRTFTELLMNDRLPIKEGRNFRWDIPSDFLTVIRRGAILISGHIGSWELMGQALVQYGVKLAVVVRRQANPLTDRYINRIRQRCGMDVVYDEELFKLRRHLADGHAIALLADQDYGKPGEPVVFFGRPCRAPAGPGRLAVRLKIPVYLCTSYRKNGVDFTFSIKPVPFSDEADIGEITSRYTAMLETLIRKHPDQWLWQHKRWKLAK